MSEKIKKIASSLGLRSAQPKSNRNVTPPNTTQPLDPEITPPGQIIDTATLESPPDTQRTTLLTPLADASSPSQSTKAFVSAFGSATFRKKPTPAQLEPLVFGQGVTGADRSSPIFDGTSSNPHDYLIDLETESMELYPDVRSYFHWVGILISNPGPPSRDLQQRKMEDAKYVRQGRLHIQAERARGHGLYLDSERSMEIMAANDPEGRWHRMPAAGIVEKFLLGELKPTDREGGFNTNPQHIIGPEPSNQAGLGSGPSVILTNIRSALWWGDALRQGIEIGTRGYDFAIHSLYSPRGHPASVMWAAMGGRLTITDNLGLCHSNLFDHDKVNEIVNSQWVRKEDDPERYQDSDDELDSTPNRLIFDPAFLAEIEPAKSKGLFDRFK